MNLSSSISVTYPEAVEDRHLSNHPPPSRSLHLQTLPGSHASLGRRKPDGLAPSESSEEAILRSKKSGRRSRVTLPSPSVTLVNQARLRKADEILSKVMSTPKETFKSLPVSLGNLSIHPFWGIPILLLVLFVTYEFVGVFGAQISVDFLEKTVFGNGFSPL